MEAMLCRADEAAVQARENFGEVLDRSSGSLARAARELRLARDFPYSQAISTAIDLIQAELQQAYPDDSWHWARVHIDDMREVFFAPRSQLTGERALIQRSKRKRLAQCIQALRLHTELPARPVARAELRDCLDRTGAPTIPPRARLHCDRLGAVLTYAIARNGPSSAVYDELAGHADRCACAASLDSWRTRKAYQHLARIWRPRTRRRDIADSLARASEVLFGRRDEKLQKSGRTANQTAPQTTIDAAAPNAPRTCDELGIPPEQRPEPEVHARVVALDQYARACLRDLASGRYDACGITESGAGQAGPRQAGAVNAPTEKTCSSRIRTIERGLDADTDDFQLIEWREQLTRDCPDRRGGVRLDQVRLEIMLYVAMAGRRSVAVTGVGTGDQNPYYFYRAFQRALSAWNQLSASDRRKRAARDLAQVLFHTSRLLGRVTDVRPIAEAVLRDLGRHSGARELRVSALRVLAESARAVGEQTTAESLLRRAIATHRRSASTARFLDELRVQLALWQLGAGDRASARATLRAIRSRSLALRSLALALDSADGHHLAAARLIALVRVSTRPLVVPGTDSGDPWWRVIGVGAQFLVRSLLATVQNAPPRQAPAPATASTVAAERALALATADIARRALADDRQVIVSALARALDLWRRGSIAPPTRADGRAPLPLAQAAFLVELALDHERRGRLDRSRQVAGYTLQTLHLHLSAQLHNRDLLALADTLRGPLVDALWSLISRHIQTPGWAALAVALSLEQKGRFLSASTLFHLPPGHPTEQTLLQQEDSLAPSVSVAGLQVELVAEKTDALVDYVRYPRLDRKRRTPSGHGYLALVVPARGPVRGVDLGDAAAIDRDALKLVERLSDPNRPVIRRARALYRQVWRPLRAVLSAKAARLVVSTDGALSFLPLGALHDGSDYLISHLTVRRVPSSLFLLRPTAAPTSRPAQIITAPATDRALRTELKRRLGVTDAQLAGLAPLSGARAEGRAIRRILDQPDIELYNGADATESNLVQESEPAVPDILHIASHGLFIPASRSSAPALERALLVMSASRASRKRGTYGDGVFTAAEVTARMNLRGTQLVVLSACESGAGRADEISGVVGLRHAFLLAGAQSLVTSLWRVNDAVTRTFMVRFYREITGGTARDVALRRAALSVRAGFDHPYFWAPFILSGDGGVLRRDGNRAVCGGE